MASTDTTEVTDGFETLGLDPRILSSLSALGYEEPTGIQREAIPLLLAGKDVLGQAATGTGKTAAFALPLLQRILPSTGKGRVSALILVPTRELAMQVAEAVHRYGRSVGATVLPIYGGQSMIQQLRALHRGVDVVVGTPGRVLDHLRRETLVLEHLRMLVLDEADEMLDMGFAEDLEAILTSTPAERQTALFSATMPPRIAQIASRHLKDPVRITIAREPLAAGEMPKVRQIAYLTPRAYKGATLGRVLDVENPESVIVFCRTRTEVDELTESLNGHGYRAEALHGGMSQDQRDRVMGRFRAGTTELLIATDVAARGLDIEHVSHVVNYDVPASPEAYVHRIGRTGRAGRTGVAITLVEPREHRQLRNIEFLTKRRIELGTVPTLADLRSRRLEFMKASLKETLLAGNLDSYRSAVESLGAEFDVMDIAAAAVKLAQTAAGLEREEHEIPVFEPGRKGDKRKGYEGGQRDSYGGPGRGRYEDAPRPYHDRNRGGGYEEVRRGRSYDDGGRGRPDHRDEGPGQGRGVDDAAQDRPGEGAARPGRARDEGAPARGRDKRESEGSRELESGDPGSRPLFRRTPAREGGQDASVERVRLYISAGRQASIRPQDLVGALAKGAGIDARSIGSIEIWDRHALVEVSDDDADHIIETLNGSRLRGRTVMVRRFREP